MNKTLIERIRELFFSQLDAKTGWGKNDIKELYNKCVAEALLEHIDSLTSNAWQMGYNAYKNNTLKSANPFINNLSQEYADWISGWIQGKIDYEDSLPIKEQ